MANGSFGRINGVAALWIGAALLATYYFFRGRPKTQIGRGVG